MYELATWIDKNFEEILDTELYKKYFGDNRPTIIVEEVTDLSVVNLNRGIDIIFTETLFVTAIHLLTNSKQPEANTFKDELPFQLSFSFSRKKTHQILGEPQITGGNMDSPFLGHINHWDKYLFDTYSLHFSYSKDENQIEQVTLGSLKFEEEALPE